MARDKDGVNREGIIRQNKRIIEEEKFKRIMCLAVLSLDQRQSADWCAVNRISRSHNKLINFIAKP